MYNGSLVPMLKNDNNRPSRMKIESYLIVEVSHTKQLCPETFAR